MMKNYSGLAKEASEMIFRGMDETKVESYVFEQVEKNPYIFKDVWQKVMYFVEVAEI